MKFFDLSAKQAAIPALSYMITLASMMPHGAHAGGATKDLETFANTGDAK